MHYATPDLVEVLVGETEAGQNQVTGGVVVVVVGR